MPCESLTSQRPLSDLAAGLRREEPIIYRDNGNRASDAPALLARVEQLLPLIGVTRVGELSHLAANRFPVFQSSRPKLLQHPAFGQNGGSQGKGNTPLQAKLSCIMESIEGYCAEPRSMQLVRGSHAHLSRHHAILDPRGLLHKLGAPLATLDEPLMWTEAYHVGLDAPVLVPAEAIYGYLLPWEYKTASHFSASSNGLASGGVYLEAAVHGLYEVIERLYLALFDVGLVEVECLTEFEYDGFDIADFNERQNGEFELQLFALKIPNSQNLPMVVCKLAAHGIMPTGFGCCGDVNMAIGRAISEALQSYATAISGAREDMGRWQGQAGRQRYSRDPSPLPAKRTLWIHEYREQVLEATYRSLREEYEAILGWLSQAGYENVCIANLTRIGLDVPVVKIYVAGLPAGTKGQGDWYPGGEMLDVSSRQFCFDPARGASV